MTVKLNKKILLFIIAVVLVSGLGTSMAVSAESFENNPEKGIESANVSDQNYSSVSETVRSYLYHNKDGTYNRVEIFEKYIYSEIYSKDFKYKSQKKIKAEMDIIGGVYINDDTYFVIEGQNNLDKKTDTTEFRIIKYNKNWKKLDSVNLKNVNTVCPFDFGSCRFAEDNGMLYIHTCHKMYNGHQANVMIKLDMADCKVITADCDGANVSFGYVSHSFNQFVDCKDGVLYACDHGDSYPRGIAIMRFDVLEKGEEYFNNEVKSVVPFKFAGKTGNNYTGASLGGFGLSSTHAIAAGSSVKQNSSFEKNKNSNIFIITTALDNFDDSGSQVLWFTNYKEGGKRKAGTPQMVKINDDRFLVMWEEYTKNKNGKLSSFDCMCYVTIDGKGKKLSEVKSLKTNLSDCQPILCGDKIVWYVTHSSTPVFYQLPIDGEVLPDKKGMAFTKNGLKYKIIKSGETGGEVAVTGYNKSGISGYDESLIPGYFEIAETITYNGYSYKLTEIAENAFQKCTKITGIYIPPNITKIGAGAFNGCKKLVSVQLEYKKYSTKNVGKNAFKNIAPKAQIIVPAAKKKAYQKLFSKCGLPKTAEIIDINSILPW